MGQLAHIFEILDTALEIYVLSQIGTIRLYNTELVRKIYIDDTYLYDNPYFFLCKSTFVYQSIPNFQQVAILKTGVLLYKGIYYIYMHLIWAK